MRKIIRIILSPIVFILGFVTYTAVLIGPATLIGGSIIRLYRWLIESKEVHPSYKTIFMWVTFPWEDAKSFIKGGNL